MLFIQKKWFFMTAEAVLRTSGNKGRHVWPFQVFRYLKSGQKQPFDASLKSNSSVLVFRTMSRCGLWCINYYQLWLWVPLPSPSPNSRVNTLIDSLGQCHLSYISPICSMIFFYDCFMYVLVRTCVKTREIETVDTGRSQVGGGGRGGFSPPSLWPDS